MKRLIKIIFIIFAVILIISISISKINTSVKDITGVVVKVNEDSLIIYEDNNESIKINYSKDGNREFKQGQDIKVYYTDNIIDETGLYNIKKIKILKEKSDIELTDELISHYNNSIDKMSVFINEFTNRGLTIMINDSNEIPFSFSNEYSLKKKNKNEKNVSNLSEPISDYNWIDLNAISEVSKEDTIEELSYTVQDKTKDNLIGKKIDWSQLYGELTEGEYIFTLLSNSDRFSSIAISFKVYKNGIIDYEEPKIEY